MLDMFRPFFIILLMNLNLTSVSAQITCPQPNGLFPYPNNCKRYIQCSNGVPIVRRCPEESHFDPILGICDRRTTGPCNPSLTTHSSATSLVTTVAYSSSSVDLTQITTVITENNSRTETIPTIPATMLTTMTSITTTEIASNPETDTTQSILSTSSTIFTTKDNAEENETQFTETSYSISDTMNTDSDKTTYSTTNIYMSTSEPRLTSSSFNYYLKIFANIASYLLLSSHPWYHYCEVIANE